MKRLFFVPAILIATPALAHLDPSEHGSVAAGLSHPLFGLDHILAMIVVGLWAAQIGGRAIWAVPASFVSAMLFGFALSLIGLPLPLVEPMILASSVALGLLVTMAVRPDPRIAVALVGLFALFHGHAHGAELGHAEAATFGLGFAVATATLHGVGAAVGVLLKGQQMALRILGGGTALAGLMIAFS
ncbi:HupE / UreJ protein [Thalassovita gelatinovora]|uniref:HupE / UreJ protein n=1 Tax=Thalassovita gelatinovora TaxID=53501 RepID=A0A0N7LU28_THAGE|nr:HupE/UreJ family protein [Thalassovita gelatinovora]QIZ81770.1 HupE/UreJ family protein [Thalassovita gelatinovora]CUH62338.1 HupE / UreJ protein [Thalassovita gelatinovora]SER16007.1 urease accessory protein [Thalassovita gelatinovora]